MSIEIIDIINIDVFSKLIAIDAEERRNFMGAISIAYEKAVVGRGAEVQNFSAGGPQSVRFR